MEQLAQWDSELLVWLNGLEIGRYKQFWLLITHIENWIPLYLLFLVLFLVALSRKRAIITTIFTVLVLLTALGLTDFVKQFVGRLRPNNTPELAESLHILQTPMDYSFWSGHAAVSFAVTLFVVWVLRAWSKWIYLVFIWPLLFATSRIFAGVHYPSDIFVGACVGFFIAVLYHRLYSRITQ